MTNLVRFKTKKDACKVNLHMPYADVILQGYTISKVYYGHYQFINSIIVEGLFD